MITTTREDELNRIIIENVSEVLKTEKNHVVEEVIEVEASSKQIRMVYKERKSKAHWAVELTPETISVLRLN